MVRPNLVFAPDGSTVMHALVLNNQLVVPSHGNVRIEVRSLGDAPSEGSVFVIEQEELRNHVGIITRFEASQHDPSKGIIVLTNTIRGSVFLRRGTHYATAYWVSGVSTSKTRFMGRGGRKLIPKEKWAVKSSSYHRNHTTGGTAV